MTTHAIQLTYTFNTTHPLVILLQLSGVTSYFDLHSLSIAEYKNKKIPKIHLITEKPPWDPSTNEYSKRETWILDHQGQISIPATTARGPVFVSLHPVFSDMMFTSAVSRRGTRSAQVFATDLGVWDFPMASRSEAHEDGVLHRMMSSQLVFMTMPRR